jgi:hypothetical protein
VREQLYRAFVTRAGESNAPLIDKVLTLRREQAQLLGFSTHAEVSLTRKMAGTVEAVAELTEMLRAKALPAAKQVREVAPPPIELPIEEDKCAQPHQPEFAPAPRRRRARTRGGGAWEEPAVGRASPGRVHQERVPGRIHQGRVPGRIHQGRVPGRIHQGRVPGRIHQGRVP